MCKFYFNDNNQGADLWSACDLISDKEKTLQTVNGIANNSLQDLLKENPDLLVFPTSFNTHNDDIDKTPVFNLNSDNQLHTNNLMGFIGSGDVKITIGSRFDTKKEKQYFLQYMLAKVFAINLIDLSTNADNENIWDFLLMYIFPHYLNIALKQGLYKEYVKVRHNDANIKGAIDIARHLKTNLPFAGKIAYNTREYSYDNPVTQLIRHTINYIRGKGHINALQHDSDTVENVKLIEVAAHTYNIRDRHSIINTNYRQIRHPYFTGYENLRKICMRILKGEGLSMQNNRDKVYGLLFDGAWLWEEYLNNVLGNSEFIHPENKTHKHGIKLFKSGKTIYPDFYKKDKSVIIDAKYKRLQKENEFSREDTYQVISYMYRLKAQTGILLYPLKNNDDKNKREVFTMHEDSYGGKNAKFLKYGLKIPQANLSFSAFEEEIQKSEKQLKTDMTNE